MSEPQQEQQLTRSMNVSYSEPPLPRASLVIWIVGIGLVIFFIWAWVFKLEEVSTGTGKVIPSSKRTGHPVFRRRYLNQAECTRR